MDKFSEKGYSGTSIAEIAKEAGLAKGLVQYHYPTKEELWQAALESELMPFLEKVDEFLVAPGDIRDLIKCRFQLILERPRIVRLIGWASLDPSPIPASIQTRAPRIRALMMQHEGPPGFPALIAAMDGWFLLHRFYSAAIGIDLDQPEAHQRALDNILMMADALIEAAKGAQSHES